MQVKDDFTKEKIIRLFIFGLAMAYLEAAVGGYLRLLYYPHGFYFSFKIIPTNVAVV